MMNALHAALGTVVVLLANLALVLLVIILLLVEAKLILRLIGTVVQGLKFKPAPEEEEPENAAH